MVMKRKKYFSFFGILSATTSRISSILSKMPEIIKQLLEKQLKPIKLYSTNNIK